MARSPLGPVGQVRYGDTVAVKRGFYEGQLGYVREINSETSGRDTLFGIQLTGFHDSGQLVYLAKSDLERESVVPAL